MAKDLKLEKERVQRFGKTAITAHWAHSLTFFALALTGMIIYFDSFKFLAPLFGGIQGARLVHRVMAVGFIVLPIISLIANFRGFLQWMIDVTYWGKNDIGFLKKFPKEFFGFHVEMPPQGRFNGGEKINSILQVIGCTVLALSGIIIWFKGIFPLGMIRLALPIHDLAFILTFTAALGHMYMALGLPSSNHAIKGMLTGFIDGEFARTQYPLWYQKLKKEE